MVIREPLTPGEFEAYYQLRWEILRKPWGHARGSELDQDEESAFHLMALNERNEAVGVARLQYLSETQGQVRFMAVRDDQQGKGVGKAIMHHVEKLAHEKGIKLIVLQARENAVNFYKNLGYVVIEKTFKLWDIIQHYRMEKTI